MRADLYCEHGRLDGLCEECAYQDAKQRNVPVRDHLYRKEPPAAKVDTVDEDTLVDIGEGASVLVAAGDDLPADLMDKPRHPREAKAKARRK